MSEFSLTYRDLQSPPCQLFLCREAGNLPRRDHPLRHAAETQRRVSNPLRGPKSLLRSPSGIGRVTTPVVTETEPAPPTIITEEVTVSVARLTLGKALHFPMHDDKGVLLLAQGAVITPEFKRLLETRQVADVRMRAEDAAELAELVAETTPAAPRLPVQVFDDRVSSQLQVAVSRWLSTGGNRGPAFQQRTVRNGCRAYDRDFATELGQQQLKNTATLTMVMSQVQGGRLSQVATSAMSAIQSSMNLMATDMDSVLAQRLSGCPDSKLARHCLRMSQVAMAIGVEMGLNAENVSRIGITGLLHDWGMLRVPETVRQTKYYPTRHEMLELQKHVGHSLNMLERLDGIPSMVPMLSYQVHEKLDGTGYPRRKLEPNIHLFARVLHVADDFVSLTTATGWRPAVRPYAAVSGMLRQLHGRAADLVVLRALLRAIGLFPIGSLVKLSDDSTARVLRSNGDRYTQPIVQLTDAKGQPLSNDGDSAVIDLSAADGLQIVSALPTPGENELDAIPDPIAFQRVDGAHAEVSAPKFLGQAAPRSA